MFVLSNSRLIALILLVVPLFTSATPDTVPLLVRQRILANGNTAPMTGFTKALLKYFEQSLDVRFDVHPYPWRRAIALAARGDGLLWGIPPNADSSGELVFSKPVYKTHIWMVARTKDHLSVDSLRDLSGMTISSFGGSHYSNAFEQARGTLFQVQDDPDSITIRFEKLKLGRVDVVLLHSRHDDPRQVQTGFETYFNDGSLEILPRPLESESIAFAAQVGSAQEAVITRLDKAIVRGQRNHVIARIVSKAEPAYCEHASHTSC